MPTPLAHGVAAWATIRTANPKAPLAPRLFVLAAFLAIAPDLDFLLGAVVGRPEAFHRGATHSLVGAALASFAIARLLSRVSSRGNSPSQGTAFWFAVVMPAWCAHIALDLVMPDTNGATGMRLFWPFSGQFVGLPMPLPHAVRAFIDLEIGADRFGFVKALLSVHGLAVLLVEGLLFTPLLLAPRLIGGVRGRLAALRPDPGGGPQPVPDTEA